MDLIKIKELKIIIDDMMKDDKLTKEDKIELLNGWFVCVDSLILTNTFHSLELLKMVKVREYIVNSLNVL